ncbi:MAG: 4Fe-4S ferredoxin [candidate division Zixibacteria bacterium RBG_16_53_22]|nr:MAG: 4Fe-4S ferredoxin [candidate division Zixibacteria bacterium RBG_16_53_22]
MTRWGMVIDLDRCSGCQACVVACRQENNIPVVGREQAAMGRAIFWMQIIEEREGGHNEGRTRYLPRPCMHCDNPPCVKVCPVGATYRNPEGLVGQIYARCIGCRYCTAACPYTARYFNWYEPSWEPPREKSLNPDVYVRPKGVVEKCSFCVHRIRKAQRKAKDENREIEDGEVIPACAETCPSKAIHFGDLDDPDSEVSKLAGSRRAFRLEEFLGTDPKVIYLREGEWSE